MKSHQMAENVIFYLQNYNFAVYFWQFGGKKC